MLKKIKAAQALYSVRGYLLPGFQARYICRAGTRPLYHNALSFTSSIQKGEYRLPDVIKLFIAKSFIIVFSLFANALIKSIKPLKAHAIDHVAFRPHFLLRPILGKYLIKFQMVMPWHYGFWGCSAERDYCAQTASFSEPWGDYDHWSGFNHLRGNHSMKITDKESTWVWMKINRHIPAILKVFTCKTQEICHA